MLLVLGMILIFAGGVWTGYILNMTDKQLNYEVDIEESNAADEYDKRRNDYYYRYDFQGEV